jgi:hypothetical protein
LATITESNLMGYNYVFEILTDSHEDGVVGFVVEAMADRVVLVTEATHLIYKNAESVSITAVADRKIVD